MEPAIPKSKMNKYDYGLVFLLALLAFGGIGGAFEPVRLVGFLFAPIVIHKLLTGKISKQQKWILVFFVCWFYYMLLSLIWTPNRIEGVKEVFYYLDHFMLFFLLIFWSQKAEKPLKSILIGWIAVLALTIPFAYYEIITYNHLPISRVKDQFSDLGDIIIPHRYASVTFFNYNTYVVLVIFCLPFLLTQTSLIKKTKYKILYWVGIIACSVVLIINSSRGGIICLGIILFIYFFYYQRRKLFRFRNIIPILIVLMGIIYLTITYSDVLLSQLAHRLSNKTSIHQAGTRAQLYIAALISSKNSLFLGTGVGSAYSIMLKMVGKGTLNHNLFLEVLMQYGLLIFVLFLIFLFKIFKKIKEINYKPVKFILIAFIFTFLPLMVINASYLLMPSLWLLLSSLFIIGSNEKIIRLQ